MFFLSAWRMLCLAQILQPHGKYGYQVISVMVDAKPTAKHGFDGRSMTDGGSVRHGEDEVGEVDCEDEVGEVDCEGGAPGTALV
jgi:hypothetical protein